MEGSSIGEGPIELLWLRLVRGELSQAAAVELARQVDEELLSGPYLIALVAFAGEVVGAGDPAGGVRLLRLMVEALDARPGGLCGDEEGRRACAAYLDSTRHYVRERADGPAFHRAERVGREALAEARERGDREAEVDALQALGLLYLDPYAGARRTTDLEGELYRWRRDFQLLAGDELDEVDPGEREVPDPREALATAYELLTEAARGSSGHALGATSKQAAQAALFGERLGLEVDRDAVLALLRTAREQLDPDSEPESFVEVLNYLLGFGEGGVEAELEALLERSVDEWVRRLGASRALAFFRQVALALRSADPARATEVLRRVRPLVELLDDEHSRLELWLDQLNAACLEPVGGLAGAAVPADLEALAAAARERAEAEERDVSSLARELLWLAMNSPAVDGEGVALELLDECERLAPALAVELAGPLAYNRATLRLNLGVNALDEGDFDAALGRYLEALGEMVELGLGTRARDVLMRIDDLAGGAGEDGTISIVVGLAGAAPRLERVLGDEATRLMQAIYASCLARVGGGPVNPEALLILSQLIKGQRFAMQLGAGAAFNWSPSPAEGELLDAIAELERALGGEEPSSDLDEATLLSPYSDGGDGRDGSDERDRLANLRRSYDRRFHSGLALGPEQSPLYIDQATLESSIDERTVLLSPHLGVTASGNLGVLTIVATAEELRLVRVELPIPGVEGDGRILGASSPAFANLVGAIREGLRAPSEPLPVDPDVAQLLPAEAWFGVVLPELEELRLQRGKDHLCVVPHGPLHSLPFHLLHHEEVPLAERWAVSYLPNTRLLLSRPAPPSARAARRAPAAALGLSYADGRPHGLAPLPQATTEARSVAAAYGVEPLLDEQVTEATVTEALGGARVVHLAAHGRHDVEAPAFQCLYVTPGEGSDGRLRAHELLRRDLWATEIVTLSACETALGRFDVADNPRGLPATLLLAGVATLVGTLWPVETNASAHFFTAFHGELAQGVPRLEAFTGAQRATRSSFPAYRDWGAFYFMGDWLEPMGAPS